MKRWTLVSVFVVLFLILALVYSFFFKNKFTLGEDSLYWFFSTVAQSFLTLIAFLGMIAIFRLQNISTLSNSFVESSKKLLIKFKGAETEFFTVDDCVKNCKEIPGELYSRAVLKIEDLAGKEKFIKERIISFSSLSFLVIILSIFFIPITPIIAGSFLSVLSVELILLLVLISVQLAMELIESLLKK